jgi:hypothetical protein
MGAIRIICPGCEAALSSAEALEQGKMIDCPRCRLLFVATTDDLSKPRSRGDADCARPQSDVPRHNPSASPFGRRRRYRRLAGSEFGPALVAGVVILGLAGVMVGVYVLAISRAPSSARPAVAPPTPAAPSSAAVPDTSPLSPAPAVVEVEDNKLPLHKPVPAIDDDPPGKPGSP